jgi:hypothetical protein
VSNSDVAIAFPADNQVEYISRPGTESAGH